MSHPAILRAAKVSGIPAGDIAGPCRKPYVCFTRYVVMAALRDRGLSLPAIGRIVHRDHSTILYGLRQAEKLRGLPGFEIIRSAIA